MYMPLAVDIRKAYIFGGERGEGLQKTQKLALFADEILVIPEGDCSSEIFIPAGYPSELKEKLYLEQSRRVPVHPQKSSETNLEDLLLPGPGVFVVSDLTDRSLNEKISRICQSRGILCNVIDTKDLCTVWFMSLIRTPNLTVALSTRGGAAYYSARMREELQEEVENRDEVAGILRIIRDSLPRGIDRIPYLDRVYYDKEFQELVTMKRWTEALSRGMVLSRDS